MSEKGLFGMGRSCGAERDRGSKYLDEGVGSMDEYGDRVEIVERDEGGNVVEGSMDKSKRRCNRLAEYLPECVYETHTTNHIK